MAKFQYAAPASLEDAFALLSGAAGDAAPLAGGTDLINNIRIGAQSPKSVILLRKIRELSGAVEEKPAGVLIGAWQLWMRLRGMPICAAAFRRLPKRRV